MRDNNTGLLYRHGDIEGLVAACDRLLADTALRQRPAQAAAKEIPGRYTWDYSAVRVVELVRSLIASRGAVR